MRGHGHEATRDVRQVESRLRGGALRDDAKHGPRQVAPRAPAARESGVVGALARLAREGVASRAGRSAKARSDGRQSLPCPWPRPTVPLPPASPVPLASGRRSGAALARPGCPAPRRGTARRAIWPLVVGRPLAAVGHLVGLGLGVCQDVARCRSRPSRASGGLRPPPPPRRGPQAGRSPWTRRSGPGRRGADTRGPPRTRGQRRRSRAAYRRGRHPTERARRRSRGASPRTGARRRTCARPSRRWARRLAGVARQQDLGPDPSLPLAPSAIAVLDPAKSCLPSPLSVNGGMPHLQSSYFVDIIPVDIERPLDVIVAGREIGREPCCGEPPLGPSACLSGLALLGNAFDGSVLPPAHVSSLYRHKFRPGDLNQRSS